MVKATGSNPLAVTSLVVSIVAVAVCFGGALLTDTLEHLKTPSMQYPPRRRVGCQRQARKYLNILQPSVYFGGLDCHFCNISGDQFSNRAYRNR